MKGTEEPLRIHLVVHSSLIAAFHPLLQTGVSLEAPTGISVKEFLCGVLGLSKEYLDTVVQTVFLNGKAVDDLDSAFIEKGATMTLSAAMPGLLGATLRRGSYYAAMRKEISYQGRQESSPSRMERIKVKVFNLLLEELGRVLLGRGIWVDGGDLRVLFGKLDERFWAGCREARLNDREMEPDTLRAAKWGEKEVFLQVTGD